MNQTTLNSRPDLEPFVTPDGRWFFVLCHSWGYLTHDFEVSLMMGDPYESDLPVVTIPKALRRDDIEPEGGFSEVEWDSQILSLDVRDMFVAAEASEAKRDAERLLGIADSRLDSARAISPGLTEFVFDLVGGGKLRVVGHRWEFVHVARVRDEWLMDEDQLVVWMDFDGDPVVSVPALRFPSSLVVGEPTEMIVG